MAHAVDIRANAVRLVRANAARLGMDAMAADLLARAIQALPAEESQIEREKLRDRLLAAAAGLRTYVDRRRLPSLGAATRAIDALVAAAEAT